MKINHSAVGVILVSRAGTAHAEVLVDTRRKIVRLKKGPGAYRRQAKNRGKGNHD